MRQASSMVSDLKSLFSPNFRLSVLALAAAMSCAWTSGVAAQSLSPADVAAIGRIRDEGMNRSRVMETTSWLTDVYGPRLTNSPNEDSASVWTMKTLAEWGIFNPRLETWGPFGRGWRNDFVSVRAITPQPYPIAANVTAWSAGTAGAIRGDAVIGNSIVNTAEMAKFKGKLRGKYVLVSMAPDAVIRFTSQGSRYTDEELAELGNAVALAPAAAPGLAPDAIAAAVARRAAASELAAARLKFFADEGVAGLISAGRGDGGTIFGGGMGGSRTLDNPATIPSIAMSAEHYGRILRTLEKGIPVTLELDIRNTFFDSDLGSANILADLPGTDSRLKDEVVMLGAHFDSWNYGTGATDNAAGSAVMMEAMRILKASGAKLRRTVRIGLWTGEEQGLLGSRAYVTKHFGDRTTMKLSPAHAKFAGYFNVDNGTGAIRGVYLQGNSGVASVFNEWMTPLNDLGMKTLTIQNTGGTDHQSFDAVGLPGFQFIQDEIEYSSRTHHSNADVYERVQAGDMKKNAVIVATFVYLTANRDALLPRKPLPAPRP